MPQIANKMVMCYEITVKVEYDTYNKKQSDKTFRMIAESEKQAKDYVKNYCKQRHYKKILGMNVKATEVLDLTQEIEVEYGTIGARGNGKLMKHPDLDMYDRVFD